MKLRYMLGSTDEEFEKRIEAIRERRQRFESGVVNDEFLDLEKIHDDQSMVNRTTIDIKTETE